ncbi:MAG: hypothetical protein B7Z69_06995 [Actinobacteria bacterium 21-73-9]|nr:MAG: hypothetical protein B7Z69_06995 [Actinobacteria bacterium 21-73-9]
MDEMGIGEFSRRSRLSVRALRLYDEMGLLAPSRVEPGSGYRHYEPDQLERARLIAALRRLEIPLADIAGLLELDAAALAGRVAARWRGVEEEHVTRRRLVSALVDELNGKREDMYEVKVRDVPERHVLSVKRHVTPTEAWDLGKEFLAGLRDAALPRVEGEAGEVFAIYWGEVSEDSDGPVEWCRPIPEAETEALAARLPELTVRVEPAHREAYVEMGPYANQRAEDWPLADQALRDWARRERLGERGLAIAPEELGVRVTYAFTPGGPDCDFAVAYLE